MTNVAREDNRRNEIGSRSLAFASYSDKKSPRNNPKLAFLNSKHNRNKSDAKLLKNYSTEQVARVYGAIDGRHEKVAHMFPITDNLFALNSSVVDKYSVKTRTGMIPNLKKSN
jgi:hypothetical protein